MDLMRPIMDKLLAVVFFHRTTPLDKGDRLAIAVFFLILLPFISSRCLVSYAEKKMSPTKIRDVKQFTEALKKLRRRQLISAVIILSVFTLSLAVVWLKGELKFSYISCLSIISVILLAQSVFGKLGWEIQTLEGETVLEYVNQWWSYVFYAGGLFILFLTLFLL